MLVPLREIVVAALVALYLDVAAIANASGKRGLISCIDKPDLIRLKSWCYRSYYSYLSENYFKILFLLIRTAERGRSKDFLTRKQGLPYR